MPGKWTFEDINWSLFNAAKVNFDILRVIKAGSLIEYNSSDYGLYLKGVFEGDSLFQKEIEAWSKDEIKHGKVLAQWVKMVDSGYDFEDRFKAYIKGFPIDTKAKESIRGSQASELLTRCMVEIGTSSFYTAIKNATHEPLLKHICSKIAADELRHYKLFYAHFKRYQAHEKLNLLKRLKIALGRLLESAGDELAFAYYTANNETTPYNRRHWTQVYGKTVYKNYEREHVHRSMALFCKAIDITPQGWFHKGLTFLAYKTLSLKAISYERKAKV